MLSLMLSATECHRRNNNLPVKRLIVKNPLNFAATLCPRGELRTEPHHFNNRAVHPGKGSIKGILKITHAQPFRAVSWLSPVVMAPEHACPGTSVQRDGLSPGNTPSHAGISAHGPL
ncbi:hypothetical protein EC162594_01339 [Escherichia coli O145:H28]|nr:hypothetical protein BvCmsKSP058_00511 [Escherichia coli]GEE16944.1 hypothetical protein EC131719_00225 [Escherichia coli O145:H28]GDP77758.1 hypothetical protein BvCmsNSP007_02839 [Escherichia coli]GDV08028.1 hypothetical protein BvCmsSIP025_00270 [Escherichia coli]GEE31465.1 hypothetical protein EC142179_04956 [Escherichia coli O145:H28]